MYFPYFITYMSIGFLIIAASLALYQVITRFVFASPSTWSEVITRSAMIWSVFLGVAVAFRHGAMISVEIRRWSGREGMVSVDGELWRARSRTPLAAGDEATVVAVSNLTLRVELLARSIAADDSP